MFKKYEIEAGVGPNSIYIHVTWFDEYLYVDFVYWSYTYI